MLSDKYPISIRFLCKLPIPYPTSCVSSVGLSYRYPTALQFLDDIYIGTRFFCYFCKGFHTPQNTWRKISLLSYNTAGNLPSLSDTKQLAAWYSVRGDTAALCSKGSTTSSNFSRCFATGMVASHQGASREHNGSIEKIRCRKETNAPDI